MCGVCWLLELVNGSGELKIVWREFFLKKKMSKGIDMKVKLWV